MSELSMDTCDVCVIGGGLSGLVCASELAKTRSKVVLLESAAEVGGRVFAEEVSIEGAKTPVELGASYCSAEHSELLALCRQFGAEVHTLEPAGGKDLWSIRGHAKRRPAKGFPGKSLDNLLNKVEEDSAEVSIIDPAHSAAGVQADLVSAAGALPSEDMHAALWLEGTVADVFGCTSKDLSYLQLLCAAQDTPLDLLTEVRLSKLQDMCKAMAAQIQSAGGKVHKSSRVTNIHQTQLTSRKDGQTGPPPALGRRPSVPGATSAINKKYPVRVTAETPSGRRIMDAKYVVLAVPLHSLKKIEFSPPIPPHLAIPLSRAFASVAIKATVLFARDFWRPKGLSGEVWADGQQGPITRVRDVSSTCKTGQGALETVIVGDNAYHLLQQSAEEREQMIVENLKQWFGHDAGSLKLLYQERIWEVATIFPTGVLTDCASSFSQPFDRLVFGGSDTALRNRGVLEGAVHSGRDAAAVATALLAGQPFERPKPQKRRGGSSNLVLILGALILMLIGVLFMSGAAKVAADLYESYQDYQEQRDNSGDCTGGNPMFSA